MKIEQEKFTYLVIENAPDVCEGIIRRMDIYPQWISLGYCTGITDSIHAIQYKQPQLLFMDWSLNGGSAFELLEIIQNTPGYSPYIIFNTGFQKDNPEIPVELINKYSVDKYLVKPFWEALRLHLGEYLQEAEEKIARPQKIKTNKFWIEDYTHTRYLIDADKIAFICQHPHNPRVRSFYFYPNAESIDVKMQWQKCYDLLDNYNISYFITKTRGHLVIKNFIEKFERPHVKIKGYNTRFEVVKENIRDFENWLFDKNLQNLS